MIRLRGLMLEGFQYVEDSIGILTKMMKLSSTTKNNAYAIKSVCLFADMREYMKLLMGSNNPNSGSEEQKDYIRAVYQCASVLIESETMLSRTVEKAKHVELVKELRILMENIQKLLDRAAWEIVGLYGPREAMLIVTPGFQALSGIWEEYRKTVLSMEA